MPLPESIDEYVVTRTGGKVKVFRLPSRFCSFLDEDLPNSGSKHSYELTAVNLGDIESAQCPIEITVPAKKPG